METRLKELLLGWEEGELTPAEIQELTRLLDQDPGARQELLLHSMMSSEIGQALGSSGGAARRAPEELRETPEEAPSVSSSRPSSKWRRRTAAAALAAAAAGMIAWGAAWRVFQSSLPAPVSPPVAGRGDVPPPPTRPEAEATAPKPRPESPSLAKEAGRPSEDLPSKPLPAPTPVPPSDLRAVPEAPVPAPRVPGSPAQTGPREESPSEPAPPVPPKTAAPAQVESPPPASPSPKAPTQTVLAQLERFRGEIWVCSGAERKPAALAQALLAGQGLEARGPAAEAVVIYPDMTRITFAADATVAQFGVWGAGAGSKRISLVRGSAAIDLSPQGEGAPLLLETPQAEIRSQGGYFVLTCEEETLRVDVGSGKVRLVRPRDGRSVELAGGQCVQVAPGGEWAARALLRQDKKKKGKKELEFEAKVESAIRAGIAFLKEESGQANLVSTLQDAASGYPAELVLWALERGGLPEGDPTFQKLLGHMLGADLRFTYKVSLQAMILEELERVKYQPRLAHCAQFLVDNQARNGQWSYGEPVASPEATPSGGRPRKETPTPSVPSKPDRARASDPREKREKPKVLQKIVVQKRREGPAQGDNSNSQYAALGLRACYDSGIVLPPEVLKKAQSWWREAQAAAKKGDPAGWSYGEAPSPQGRTAYGSMTAGAAGSLVMYHYMLGEPWMKDESVQKGLEWMARHFTVAENPAPDDRNQKDARWHYYYLYALERLGVMYGTEAMGSHDWYAEGANYLLKVQDPGGSWSPQSEAAYRTFDTCFAILFLRRATRPLTDVPTQDRNYPK